jgi:hypothetical protein
MRIKMLTARCEKARVARPRRLFLQTLVRYRTKGLGTWHEGIVENLSHSGVLLRGPHQLSESTLVEIVLEMPEQISGQKSSSLPRPEYSSHGSPRVRKFRYGSIHSRLQVLALNFNKRPKPGDFQALRGFTQGVGFFIVALESASTYYRSGTKETTRHAIVTSARPNHSPRRVCSFHCCAG